jgi:two-component system sensor histidine kinase YesM
MVGVMKLDLKRLIGTIKTINPLKVIRREYRNSRIFKKLIFTNTLILCVFSVISLIAVQIAFGIYNEQLYRKTVQVLGEFTTGVGNDLKSVESFSLNIALNQQVQEQLASLQSEPNDYDEFKGASTLQNMMLSQSISSNLLSTISYVSTQGKSYTLGENSGAISDETSSQLISKAIEASGSYTYLQPDPKFKQLYSAREILEYKNTSLKPLGTLLFSCDLEKTIKNNYSFLPNEKTSLCIYSNNQLIYGNNSKIHLSGLKIQNVDQGYTIRTISGHKYFIAYLKSKYPVWTYVSIMPYESMFQNSIILGYVMAACFVFLLLLSSYCSYKIARNITKPLENLTSSMKQAERGDFQNVKEDLNDYDRTDEIGYLQKDFLKMIRKIEKLIEENYEKQLVIKDTEYKALQSQIDPHFLYNTLSSVNWLARTGSCEEISELVLSLGSLLRASISKTSVISLKEEAQLLEYYINIQKLRYQDRAEFCITIKEEHLQCFVPKMILQPLVENSIKYGVENMLEICRISVTTVDKGDTFDIVVKDDGPGMEQDFLEKLRNFEVETKGTGIGLKNIDDRLKIIFSKEFGIQIDSAPGVGTTVTINIPKRVT